MKLFNVRIYALLIHENKLMLLKEPFAGELIYKFPGGGLEYGEGTRDCLKREFLEELNLEIEVGAHFYTQDFFQESRLGHNEQILMIYYYAKAISLSQLKIIDPDIQEVIWIPLNELSPDNLSLSTDQMVIEMLKNQLTEK